MNNGEEIQVGNIVDDTTIGLWNKRLKEIVKRLPPCHSGIAVWDDYNERFPKDQDCIGTLTTNIGSSTPRNGIKIIEIYETDRDIRTIKE